VLKRVRRLVVAVIGGTVLLVGAAMIVLPGPAVVVIPVGLAILATEFVWARRLLERVRNGMQRVAPPVAPDGSERDRDDTSPRRRPRRDDARS
jgi:tellurite resistance protein TerC